MLDGGRSAREGINARDGIDADMREEDFCQANEKAISKEYIGLLEQEILD